MLKIKSYAKVNLGLEVLNKRHDGYHNINTIFHKISLFDEIIIEPSIDFVFVCSSMTDIPCELNLAYKAAKELQKFHHLDALPLRITINKSIPTGAGLGGGSSNAAYTLTGIDKSLNLKTSIKDLMQIASRIGSDVAFFIGEQNSAIGSGRGEILDYFNISLPYSILLVFPEIHISTPAAYSSLKRTNNYRSVSDFKSIINDLLIYPKSLQKLTNDFEQSVFKSHPILSGIKEQLYHDKASFALMSGSGSTIYGLFESIDDAKNAQSNLLNFKSQICNSI